MTQSPIAPDHKDMAAKAAGYRDWDEAARYASHSVPRILAHAQTLANDEAKGKALAEIAGMIATETDFIPKGSLLHSILVIAAPHRASDPVAEALRAAWIKLWPEDTGIPSTCQALRDELASRGIEIVERRDR